MRISDWSSDVCSSDLQQRRQRQYHRACDRPAPTAADVEFAARTLALARRKATPRRRRVERPASRGGESRQPRCAARGATRRQNGAGRRSEEHTSELQSLMRISYAVFCLKTKNTTNSSTED